MTSVVTRQDIEDALVSAGVRIPHARNQVMRVIDFYVAGKIHGEIPDIPDPHAALLPGESDHDAKVMRCVACSLVRNVALFPVDKRVEGGRRTTCKDCEDGGKSIPGDLFLTCHGPCGQRKHASNFYRARRRGRRFGYKCKDCLGIAKNVTEGASYLCRRCGQDKPLEGFPAQKRHDPRSPFPCLDCLDKGGDGVTRSWKCPSCGKEKKSHYYPKEKQDNPRLRLNCIACGD